MPILSHRLCLILCGWTFLLGCGSGGLDLGPFGLVSGTVTCEGEPISQGMVTFHCFESGQVATANLDQDGSYTMRLDDRDGLPVGEYKVCIRPPLTVQQEGKTNQRLRNNLYDPKISKDIPMKYRYENSSGLVETVQAGDNRFDFDLRKD
jgi:hypothetical protein